MENNLQVFVKIDQYKDVLEIMNTIKTKLDDTKELLATIHRLKNEEDAELELWQNNLNETEKRLQNIDATLFEQ
jgi:predicted nuclease with TOPRIM domain